jgi:aspartyl-tRNA synthetase
VKALAECFENFYFVTDWPRASKPFYIHPDYEDSSRCLAFDLMYKEQELASGGQRVHEKELLVSNLRAQGLEPESFKYYLEAFEYGMPPHAGWGLGVARLVMALTQRANVRECVLFPRDKKRLTP